MFRYERPQKGRLRSFHQFGAEVFGISSVYEDANIINMIRKILEFFGIDFVLKINSLGCNSCMPKYKNRLVDELNSKKENLCNDCHRRIDTNPLRVLDCKVETCQNELKDTTKITDNLCENCQKDFEKLKYLLENLSIKFEVDKNLVRGLDYYNKTAFEFVSNNVGSQNAIAGGGRYDKLTEYLGGKPTFAVGFAIGVERLLPLVNIPSKDRDGYYIGALNEQHLDKIFLIASKMSGKRVIEYNPKKLANHLKNADKLNCRYCLIIGDDEIRDNVVWLKDLLTKEESRVAITHLL
jgi:histidyl-tRNA synthetase